VIALVLPITIVLPVSLTDKRSCRCRRTASRSSHYANLFTSQAWLSSIGQSLFIGIVSAAIAVTAGTLCAIGCGGSTRGRPDWCGR